MVFLTEDAAGSHAELVARLHRAGVPLRWCEPSALATLADTVTPQGIVGVCRAASRTLEDLLPGGPPPPGALLVLLSHVRDPGNMGTVIRSADAAGASGVLISAGSADPTSPKAVRASAGSIFHVPVAVGVEAAATVAGVLEAGWQVLLADGAGSLDLFEAAADGVLERSTMWVFGNEAWGVHPAEPLALGEDPSVLAGVTAVRVPIRGAAESLNLAAAATVCLYASAQAQHASSTRT